MTDPGSTRSSKFQAAAIVLVCGGVLTLSPWNISVSVSPSVAQTLKVRAESQSIPAEEYANSQTIGLLKAPNSSAALGGLGGGQVFILDSNSLAANGFTGTDSPEEEDLTSKKGKIRKYVVQEGDTVSEIASRFGVTSNTIRWSNNIAKGDTIKVGQELVILPVPGIRHTVESGESLSWIAEKYDGSVAEIREFNGMDSEEVLAIGDKIIVPNGTITSGPEQDRPEPEASTPPPQSAPPAAGGYYATPVSGAVLTQGLHGFNAVDFGAPHGTPITAAADGTVMIARQSGWNGGYGLYVVIEHANGTQTLYSHNSSNTVSVGESVIQGQVIGYIGTTGRTTGPHLHFEVRGAANPFAR